MCGRTSTQLRAVRSTGSPSTGSGEEVLERYLADLVGAVRGVDLGGPLPVLFERIVRFVLAVRPDGPELLRRLQASGVADFHGRLAEAKDELVRYFGQLLQAREVGVPAELLDLRLRLALDAAEGLLVQGAPRLPPDIFAAEVARMMAPYVVAPPDHAESAAAP